MPALVGKTGHRIFLLTYWISHQRVNFDNIHPLCNSYRKAETYNKHFQAPKNKYVTRGWRTFGQVHLQNTPVRTANRK
ncbi:hypothetical protein SAMN05216198_1387 [Halopseudomonas litoralis]|uniref:Uncharacterized protein n=1 Tax=Halopseudomonas litoralis TaxID=797277 RepID=A0A1H1Q5C7_9GAMM|nr:hypothetical protein SAMN05216198_1387 [Halopseudomonas litoralis]